MNPNDPILSSCGADGLIREHPFFPAPSGVPSKRPGPVRVLAPDELHWVTLEDIHPYPECLLFNPPSRVDPWKAWECAGEWS